MIQGTNRSQNQPHQDPKNHPQNEGKSRAKTGPKTGPQQLHAEAQLTHLPFTTPKVLSDSNGRVFVSFYFHGKRHRFYSGAIQGLRFGPTAIPALTGIPLRSSCRPFFTESSFRDGRQRRRAKKERSIG